MVIGEPFPRVDHEEHSAEHECGSEDKYQERNHSGQRQNNEADPQGDSETDSCRVSAGDEFATTHGRVEANAETDSGGADPHLNRLIPFHSTSPVANEIHVHDEKTNDAGVETDAGRPFRAFGRYLHWPLPLRHTFSAHGDTRDWMDHTGANPEDARFLARFQKFVLPRWYPDVRPTGVMDVTTRLAIVRVQHHRRVPQTGRLDEDTWVYAQEHDPHE